MFIRFCVDINECEEQEGNCEDRCINIEGLHLCSCFDKNDVISRNGLRCLSKETYLQCIIINYITITGSVTNITTIPGSRSLTLSWRLPVGYKDDGNFTGLSIICNEKEEQHSIESVIIGPKTNGTVHPLTPFANYTCCITPEWGLDIGPTNCTDSMTMQDGKPTIYKIKRFMHKNE